MPIYGKSRTNKAGQISAEEGSQTPELMNLRTPKADQTIVRDGATGHRKLGDIFQWGTKDSSVGEADYRGFPLSQVVMHIMDRAQESAPTIVDWGCGKGVAITQLSDKFPKARCYGYSREFHPQWTKNDSVKFIHAPSGELARYLKDGSVDLIYSYLGMGHMKDEEQTTEIEKLIPKLKHGGCMLIDFLKAGTIEKLSKRSDIEIGMAQVSIGIRRK
jgi:hypothetical protein